MSDTETPKGEEATNTTAEIDPEDVPKERVRKLDEEITLSDTCCYKCVEEMREPPGLPVWIFTILLSVCNFVGILVFMIALSFDGGNVFLGIFLICMFCPLMCGLSILSTHGFANNNANEKINHGKGYERFLDPRYAFYKNGTNKGKANDINAHIFLNIGNILNLIWMAVYYYVLRDSSFNLIVITGDDYSDDENEVLFPVMISIGISMGMPILYVILYYTVLVIAIIVHVSYKYCCKIPFLAIYNDCCRRRNDDIPMKVA